MNIFHKKDIYLSTAFGGKTPIDVGAIYNSGLLGLYINGKLGENEDNVLCHNDSVFISVYDIAFHAAHELDEVMEADTPNSYEASRKIIALHLRAIAEELWPEEKIT